MIEKVVHGLMSGDWKRGTVSGPQRLQSDAWTAPDLSTTAPALDSGPESAIALNAADGGPILDPFSHGRSRRDGEMGRDALLCFFGGAACPQPS